MSPSVEPFNESKYKALMDGLDCKEELFSSTLKITGYFRLEAEYYTAKGVVFKKTLKGKDIIGNIQYGTSKYFDEDSTGYPVLRLNELSMVFIGVPPKYCHDLTDEEFASLRLKKRRCCNYSYKRQS